MYCFTPRTAEHAQLSQGTNRQTVGEFCLPFVARAVAESRVELVDRRSDHRRWSVAEQQWAESKRVVDVLVPVDIDDARAVAACERKRDRKLTSPECRCDTPSQCPGRPFETSH